MATLLDPFPARFDTVRLGRRAHWLAKAFPASLLEVEDLLQIGRVGIIKISRGEEEALTQFVIRGYVAAWRDMIDVAQRVTPARNWQVYGLDMETVLQQRVTPLGLLDDQFDFERFLRGMSLRDHALLRMLAHGNSLLEIGIQLHLSEGRISQLQSALGRQYRAACL